MGADPGALTDRSPDLAALVEGRWAGWSGLDPLPGAADVARQLGEPLDPEPVGGVFAGSPTMFRRYGRNGDVAPVTVWFENDLAVAVQIDGAHRSVLDDPLPDPDDVLDSAFGEGWRQLVFAARGLVIHAREGDTRAAALVLALPPFTVDDFRGDPARHLGGERRLRG